MKFRLVLFGPWLNFYEDFTSIEFYLDWIDIFSDIYLDQVLLWPSVYTSKS